MREGADSRPLALLVTRNFPPLLGGMEKLNQYLLAALAPIWRTALCGPHGAAAYVMPPTEVRQSKTKPLSVFLIATLWQAFWLAWRDRPRLVIAGSGVTAPIAWLVARCFGGKAVVYLHGLDIVASSRVYQTLWLPFIRRCDMALVNSANTARLASLHRVPSDKLRVLHPGVELPTGDANKTENFRKHFGFEQRPLLLSVGRLTERKGLAEFVDRALPTIVSHCPNTLLVVIGDEASDALHAKKRAERERILAAARTAGVEQNIHFMGRCDESMLVAAYEAADLHIFPVLQLPGDVEGFGMVALESASHGLPTVAFDVGGVPDAVMDGSTGTLVEAGNYPAFAMAVTRRLAETRSNSVIEACRSFAADKAWPVFGERLRNLLQTLYE
jgi:phosphatidyl-myo-inositol dimannoside synthase